MFFPRTAHRYEAIGPARPLRLSGVQVNSVSPHSDAVLGALVRRPAWAQRLMLLLRRSLMLLLRGRLVLLLRRCLMLLLRCRLMLRLCGYRLRLRS